MQSYKSGNTRLDGDKNGSLVNRFAAGDEASDRTALAQAREDNDSVPWEQVKVDLPEGPGGMSACAGRFMRTSSE